MLFLFKNKGITVITLTQQNWRCWAGNGTDYITWVFCTSVIQLAFPDWQQGGRREAALSHNHVVTSSSLHDSPVSQAAVCTRS